MHLFQVLGLLEPEVTPGTCKIHLAGWNGSENPLDVYLAGNFDEWQSWQSKKNFERPFVVSLIDMSRDNHWLFAGVYAANGCEWVAEHKMNRYQLDKRPGASELEGRLVARFQRSGRQSYVLGESWGPAITVAEIRAEKMQIAAFPGYSSTMLTKPRLDIVVKQDVESWRSALASVAGVYVIADQLTSKLYIGSATGVGGIWSRWCSYSATGHGGNKELIDLLALEGASYAQNFHYGVLEIADTHASVEDILGREAHWKTLLCTRFPHGYNAN